MNDGTISTFVSFLTTNDKDGMRKSMLPEDADEDQQRRYCRNLTLAAQTVISCGHAVRVTLADLLQDFEDMQDDCTSNSARLRKSLEKAIADDIRQNLRVAKILGLNVPLDTTQ